MLGFASITNERPRKSPIGSFVIAAMLGALEVPTHASGPPRANNCAGAPTGPGGPRAFSWPRWVDVPPGGGLPVFVDGAIVILDWDARTASRDL